jgi:hypothetical protein
MDYLLKVSAITFIFYGFYKLILQRETFFQSNRWFLLIGILTALLVPLIVIPVYVESFNTPLFFNEASVSNTKEIVEEAFNWSTLLITIYSLGVLFLGGKFILNLVSLYRLISSHSKESENNYYHIKTSQNTTPFSFFNFIVYNPTKFKNNELDQIIIHEKVHAQQFHSIDILISQIVTIIFWFNPFMWLYKKEVQQNLEFIADNLAQQKSNCEKSYQKLLLKTSLHQNQLALTNNFYNSLIKKRIIMLHKNRSKSTNQWKYALILPFIATFIFTFNTKVVAQSKTKTVLTDVTYTEDKEMFIINKDSKKEDFEKTKKEISNHGVTANFKNIKRNSDGEIISISVSAKSKKSNASYNTSSDSPIKPISVSFDNKGENISIGNSNTHHVGKYFFKSKDGEHKVHSTSKSNSFVFVSKDGDVIKSKDGNHKIINIDINEDNDDENSTIWITENGDNSKIHKTSKTIVEIVEENGDDNKVIILNSKNKGEIKNPLIYIDGKEVSNEEMKKLDTDTIESMNVFKGDKAIEKYGENGKDGVISIITKEK